MNNILKNLAKLITVKTIVTIIIVGIFAYLACSGNIQPDDVKDITLLVVSFYFGTQHEKNKLKGDE